MYLCIHAAGFLVGYVCCKLYLTSWFRIRVCGSWNPMLTIELHVYDIVLEDKVRCLITEKIGFHLPLECTGLTLGHICLTWIPMRWSVLPRIHLDSLALCMRVTSVADWNAATTTSSTPAYHAHVAWTKKRQLADHLSLMAEEFLQQQPEEVVVDASMRGGPSWMAHCKDAIIASLHFSLTNFELRLYCIVLLSIYILISSVSLHISIHI
jgi:hypothetical protein